MDTYERYKNACKDTHEYVCDTGMIQIRIISSTYMSTYVI